MKRLIFLLSLLGVLNSALYGALFNHSFQVSLNLANSHYVGTETMSIPIEGTQNVLLEIVDVELNQPIWSDQRDHYIFNGALSIIVEDESINWIDLFRNRDLVFRVSMLEDLVDIPFEYLPYALFSDFTERARQFEDTDIINIDYENSRVQIHQSTVNAALAVSGSVQADFLVGDGSLIENLTGPGFSSGYSLNSEDGKHKDVIFVSSSGNVGIHTMNPIARMHVVGDVVFRASSDVTFDSYTVPTGSVLLWDPALSSFRSGIFNEITMSEDIGQYSIGFGEDPIIKAEYASILGGADNTISEAGRSSIVIAGQRHHVYSVNSVIAGGYL